MSKISLAPAAAGTAIFTIESPGTSTNRTLTLPDDTGTIVTNSGNQAGSFTTLNTSGQVVFNDAGANVDFRVEGDTEANLLFVDASTDRVGVGTSSPSEKLHVVGSVALTDVVIPLNGSTAIGYIGNSNSISGGSSTNIGLRAESAMLFATGGSTERARIDSSGNLLVGQTSSDIANTGIGLLSTGRGRFAFDGGAVLEVNRKTDDGTLVLFYQATTQEGSISVSGSTVSYNGGHLSRWAQMLTKPDLLKGTVMSNLDEMNVYVKPTLYWTEEDELPVDEEGNPTVAVGDVKEETSVSDNEQLNKVKVSDVEGDANVAGVFVNWEYDEAHQVDEINMAMTGDMIIRIAEGVTVARGDLLMSAGDGTAKPQGDDIVRSKTIAKVTSTHVTCTYEDGSYCVPCVLMAC